MTALDRQATGRLEGVTPMPLAMAGAVAVAVAAAAVAEAAARVAACTTVSAGATAQMTTVLLEASRNRLRWIM